MHAVKTITTTCNRRLCTFHIMPEAYWRQSSPSRLAIREDGQTLIQYQAQAIVTYGDQIGIALFEFKGHVEVNTFIANLKQNDSDDGFVKVHHAAAEYYAFTKFTKTDTYVQSGAILSQTEERRARKEVSLLYNTGTEIGWSELAHLIKRINCEPIVVYNRRNENIGSELVCIMRQLT